MKTKYKLCLRTAVRNIEFLLHRAYQRMGGVLQMWGSKRGQSWHSEQQFMVLENRNAAQQQSRRILPTFGDPKLNSEYPLAWIARSQSWDFGHVAGGHHRRAWWVPTLNQYPEGWDRMLFRWWQGSETKTKHGLSKIVHLIRIFESVVIVKFSSAPKYKRDWGMSNLNRNEWNE